VSGASLSANESLNVNATVNPALFSGTTIDLAVVANLTNPGGTISSNGATCSLTVTGNIPR
jgi:adhesin HecA-like repeat protein